MVMEKFNIQGKQTSFYKYCPGTFGYTLVHYDAGNLIFILMCAWHMGCGGYTLEVDVITVSI